MFICLRYLIILDDLMMRLRLVTLPWYDRTTAEDQQEGDHSTRSPRRKALGPTCTS